MAKIRHLAYPSLIRDIYLPPPPPKCPPRRRMRWTSPRHAPNLAQPHQEPEITDKKTKAVSLRKLLLACFALLAPVLVSSAHAACTTPSGNAGNVIFNSTHKVMQYCNGTNWVNTGAAISAATQSGCTSPSGLPGEVIYASDLGVIQFCNGQNWVNTACADTRTPGGSGCTTPTGSPGDLHYETTSNELQFCDSTSWVAMGWPCVGSGATLVSETILSTATAGTNYVVPVSATHIKIIAWGAGGAGMAHSGWSPRYVGGGGGFAEGTATVTPGETLSLRVGQGGPLGGGTTNNGAYRPTDGTGSAGGGYTGVFRSTTPLLIAGAGGGGGTTTSGLPGGPGGGGGGTSGQTVTSGAVTVTGGTQSAGGTATGGSNTNSGPGSYLASNGTSWTSGGSGYYGGASHYIGFGSGGSSYVGGVDAGNTVAATGQSAAQSSHEDYIYGKATGGSNSAGTDGILIIRAYNGDPATIVSNNVNCAAMGGTNVSASTCRFMAEGEYIVNLPANQSLYVQAWGAGGGSGSTNNSYADSDGGAGGYAEGTIPSTGSTRQYKVVVGSGGGARSTDGVCTGTSGLYGGPGAGSNSLGAGDGGGYSGIFLTSVAHANSILIAGGGGGAGTNAATYKGGVGGGLTGGSGQDGSATGGTQSAGGTSSYGNGSALQGGITSNYVGGGGGYYGGAGSNWSDGGGGGGSSYLDASLQNASTQSGSGRTSGGSTKPRYYASAGQGGLGQNSSGDIESCGKPGMVVIKFQ